MIHEIAKIGNPVLRQVAAEIARDEITSDRIQVFIDDLIDTMRSANGAGIAKRGKELQAYTRENSMSGFNSSC